jgi:hypothetical protein
MGPPRRSRAAMFYKAASPVLSPACSDCPEAAPLPRPLRSLPHLHQRQHDRGHLARYEALGFATQSRTVRHDPGLPQRVHRAWAGVPGVPLSRGRLCSQFLKCQFVTDAPRQFRGYCKDSGKESTAGDWAPSVCGCRRHAWLRPRPTRGLAARSIFRGPDPKGREACGLASRGAHYSRL